MKWSVTSAPRGQSCTVSNCHVAKTCQISKKVGPETFFKIYFFYRDV